jgi:hypothetical protein
VFGQLARQGLRAVAIYFSDVLLWLSLAGFFEIAFVLFASVLCILTAGFIFENMKRSPLVLVLGCAVALTGTFLMFREVRGLVFGHEGVANANPQSPSVIAPPATSTIPVPSAKTAPPPSCAGKTHLVCAVSSECYWSSSYNVCLAKLPAGPAALPGGFAAPSPRPASLCVLMTSEPMCNLSSSCYWSQLTRHCEKLLFGTRILSGKPGGASPPAPVCNLRTSKQACQAGSGCLWLATLQTCISTGP